MTHLCIIFRYGKNRALYQVMEADGYGMERGLFDWSGGREIMATLRDVWTAMLTEEEADAINEGLVEPSPRGAS